MWEINVNILPTSLLPFFRLTRHRSSGLLSGTNKFQRAIRARHHPRPQLIDVKCWRSHLSNFCSSQRSSGVFKPINYVVNVKLWSPISPWCAVEDGREVLNLNNTCFSISQLSSVWSPQSWKDGCSLRTISAGAVFPAQDQNRSSVWAAPLSVLV